MCFSVKNLKKYYFCGLDYRIKFNSLILSEKIFKFFIILTKDDESLNRKQEFLEDLITNLEDYLLILHILNQVIKIKLFLFNNTLKTWK